MIDLVRKRHDGDGWIVVQECGNRPGFPSNRADAIALSVWASKKYEAHLYEFKIDRADVKREIKNPSKVEGVGRYCTYWWLCVSDEKLLTDLVIPEAWGILAVHVDKVAGREHRRLKVIRKAPRQKPKAIDVLFAVSLIRNVRNTYADPVELRKVQEELYQARHGTADDADVGQLKYKISTLEREISHHERFQADFEAASGVSLRSGYGGRTIGAAVKTVLDMEPGLARGDVTSDVSRLSQAAAEYERLARELARSAVALRGLYNPTDHTEQCSSQSRWKGRCTCGLDPLSEIEKKLAREAAAVDTETCIRETGTG